MKPFRKTFTNQPFKKMLTKKIAKAETIHKTDGRMKPFRIFLIFGILLFLVGPMGFVSAGFACGQIKPYENVEPQWMEVRVYDNNLEASVKCSVSPAENKFCCDAEAIPDFTWKVGKEIKAEIYDESYFTEPVSLQITGEGYDVFPLMELKKAINLNYNEVVFGGSFLLNASFEEPYTYVELVKNGERDFLYEGTDYEGEIDIGHGMNYLKLVASGEGREFVEDLVVVSLDYFEFNRAINCKKCKENVVKQNQEVDVSIEVNLSDYVEGVELREYVPRDFEILETEGRVEKYSETHNVIMWNVSGKEIVQNYRVKAPKVSFFPVEYIFRTQLENEILNEQGILVSRFFSFWKFEEKLEFKDVKRKVYSRISPEKPIVVKMDSEVIKLGLIPKRTIKNAELSVEEYDSEELKDAISYYFLDTNLDLEDIDKIFVEFRSNKSSESSLYIFEQEWLGWEEITLVEEDENYNYYQAYISPTNKIALVREEESFWDFLDIFI